MDTPAETLIPQTLKWHPLPVSLEGGIDISVPTKLIDVDQENCFSCRICLKDAKIGEKVLLLSYDPWLGESPFRQHGPIYVHEEPKCELFQFKPGTSTMPNQQKRRLLSVRAFDESHMMKDGDVFQGTDLLWRAQEFFKNKEVEYLHVHYAIPGCFGVRIDRGEECTSECSKNQSYSM